MGNYLILSKYFLAKNKDKLCGFGKITRKKPLGRVLQKSHNIRDLLRIIVWYPIRWFILILPIRSGISMLQLMGDFHFYISKSKRYLLRKNFMRIFKTDFRWENAAREYFRNYYIDRLLIFIFPKIDAQKVDQYIEFEGIGNLKKGLSAGSGVILLHGHFGPVHMPLVALSLKGYQIKQIGNPTDNGLNWIGRKVAFRLRLVYENKISAEIIKADSFMRPVFRWLNCNGIIMVTGDGTGTEERIGKHAPMYLLGQPILLPLGPYLLAEKTGAVVLPMFIIPGQKKLYKIVIESPLSNRMSGNEKILKMAEQFTAKLEKYIIAHPGYMHFLDRFHPGDLIIEN